MSRIILSNKKAIVDNFINHCNSVGFKNNTLINTSDSGYHLYGAVFKKLCLDNQNFVEFESGDFVSAVGTFFYNGSMGEKALMLIYDAFKEHQNICRIRQSMNGSFVLAVCYQGMLYFISDAMGFYYSYYHIDDDKEWVLGTSLYELVKSSTFDCSVNEFNLLEECYQHSILGDDTIFNEYKKLTGDNYIEVDLKNDKIQIHRIEKASSFTLDERPLETIVHETAIEYKKLAKIIGDNFDSNDTAICMTGGLDSRTTMASLLADNIKPMMYYGIGNSPLTNTTLGDLDVNKIYAEKFGLQLKILDWSTPEKIDIAWDRYIDKYGLMASMYTSSPSVYQGFESIQEKIVFIGCLGELFRNSAEVEQKKDEFFSLDQIVNQTYLGCDMHELLGNDYDMYVQRIKNKICNLLAPYLKGEALPKNYLCVLNYHIRRNADSVVVNFMNQLRYSMSMFSEPSLFRYACIPTEYRDNSKYIIQTLNELYPPILDVPIYSRHKWQTIDKNNMQLTYQATSKADYYKALFLRNFVLGRWIRKTLYPFYIRRKEKGRVNNGQIKQDNYISLENVALQLMDIFSGLSFFKRKTNPLTSGYVPKDSHLAIILTAINKLGLSFK